ncbi:MAG: Ycf51 family protein [Elainellaceae cyanobacterium]
MSEFMVTVAALPTTSDFLIISKWLAFTTIGFGALAIICFLFKWGIRFRLVGVTGFMAVLTGGVFALGLVPFTRTVVPGAARFTTVYDAGATQAVIAVAPTIAASDLEATLKQAASNLFSPGRLGREQNQLTIRARTVLHPEEGVSQPLYLGKIERSLGNRDDDQMKVTVYEDAIAQLPQPPEIPEIEAGDS